ncbi:Holliday junction ATP-dependent DNA helicase RuvA [Methyloligella halotolerans]|uniref:Holliday junction branch migration complex subunit RuvA n=1 Tax=Methyloligella halotolerans TaxID=1177755 RepID=A0A1E2RZA0_9HYPH|nr:Holliday junction branch migration protein RuvA [Methyloligella halotolerans]ODA67563.1 Holliday junction ATP-dependent DNA helicase RuvA [Methyloligella halotolerans]
MIGKLTGKLDAVGPDTLILDVGGVGYEVTCSSRTLSQLPGVGEAVSLAIDTHVREDAIRLYGFGTEHERAWFRALQSVQGVGARVAIAVLGTLSPSDLSNAVALQDKASVARSPGVGPKVAQRIVSELKDKMPALSPAFGPGGGSGGEQPIEIPEGMAAQEAVSALTNLGYAHGQAAAAVASAAKAIDGTPKTEELIRLGLKELAR